MSDLDGYPANTPNTLTPRPVAHTFATSGLGHYSDDDGRGHGSDDDVGGDYITDGRFMNLSCW